MLHHDERTILKTESKVSKSKRSRTKSLEMIEKKKNDKRQYYIKTEQHKTHQKPRIILGAIEGKYIHAIVATIIMMSANCILCSLHQI